MTDTVYHVQKMKDAHFSFAENEGHFLSCAESEGHSLSCSENEEHSLFFIVCRKYRLCRNEGHCLSCAENVYHVNDTLYCVQKMKATVNHLQKSKDNVYHVHKRMCRNEGHCLLSAEIKGQCLSCS